MTLDLTADQLWEFLCSIEKGQYPLNPNHVYTLVDKVAPWHESFNLPWIGLTYIREGMPRDEYYFMLFSFLYYAKLAGDI